MNKSNYTEYIEAYLNYELTEQEKLGFEEELKTNEGLRKELQRHKDILTVVNIEGKQKLKSELESYYSMHQSRKKNNRRIIISVGTIAASILLLLYVVNNNKMSLPEENIITLDSALVNPQIHMADSATYLKSDTGTVN